MAIFWHLEGPKGKSVFLRSVFVRTQNVTGGEQKRRQSQQHRAAENAAEQEQCRGENGEGQCPEPGVFPKTEDPNQTVGRCQKGVGDQVHREGLVRPLAEPGAGDVHRHKRHAAKAAEFLNAFYPSVVPGICKPLGTFEGENDIGDQNDN